MLGDAHSANILLCRRPNSDSIVFLLVDGKLGGLDASGNTQRLDTKLFYENIEEHKWFLSHYKKGVEDTARASGKQVQGPDSDRIGFEKQNRPFPPPQGTMNSKDTGTGQTPNIGQARIRDVLLFPELGI